MQNKQDQMLYVSAVWLALLEFCKTRGRIIRLGADALASQTISRLSVPGQPRSDAPVAGSTGLGPPTRTRWGRSAAR